MIYFITNEPQHINKYKKSLPYNIEVLNDNEESFNLFKNLLNINKIGYDVESNGLDAWKNQTVLKILGDINNQFVFHTYYCNFSKYYKYCYDNNKQLLGHNIKFDIKFGFTEDKILYTNVEDTMVIEQRLYMKLGLRNGLDALANRYLNVYPDAMDKNIRDEFIGCNTKTFKVEPRHIYYAASDVEHLFPIRDSQEKTIEKYNMHFLIKDIEFPLISIIAKAELTGFEWDEKKWMEVYEENYKEKFQTELKLDDEFLKLRNEYLTLVPEDSIYLKGGKWDHKRIKNEDEELINDDGTTNVLDLFGEPMSKHTLTGNKTKVKKAPNNINWSSDTQITEIFGRLKEPLLTKQNILVTPTFNKKQKVDKTTHSFTTGEGAFIEYKSQLPNSKMIPLIDLLLTHRGLSTACNNFGINFKTKINPITNKLHTIFRQCFAETGRFQSGGGKKEKDKPNFQNIPSKADYAIKLRNCFKAREGYSIGTHDLSGAELIIMCSLSQDLKLLKIAMQDIHSYVAQGCWRLIYKLRAFKLTSQLQKFVDKTVLNKYNELKDLSETYIVNKSKKKIRTAFKPMTFGVIYGMYAAKAAKTLNIEKEEGQLVINFIKKEFPDVINMVETASKNAEKQGYLILNERTNSRAWFPNLIKVLKKELRKEDNFKIISKELSEARNIRIQGTQADMIKEMTVTLQKWIDDNGFTNEITILSWVHDEIIDEHPKYLDGKSEEWERWSFSAGNFISYNKVYYNNFPEVKADIMRDVANKYLNNVKMDVDYDVEPYWTK